MRAGVGPDMAKLWLFEERGEQVRCFVAFQVDSESGQSVPTQQEAYVSDVSSVKICLHPDLDRIFDRLGTREGEGLHGFVSRLLASPEAAKWQFSEARCFDFQVWSGIIAEVS